MDIEKFIEDAVADGWEIRATYDKESIERAVSLTKNGWSMSVINKPSHRSIHIWGPDKLAVKVPDEYEKELHSYAI